MRIFADSEFEEQKEKGDRKAHGRLFLSLSHDRKFFYFQLVLSRICHQLF